VKGPRAPSILAAAVVLAFLAAARAALALEKDVFDDYKTAGTAEDVRKKPSQIQVGGLGFEPTIDYKVLGVVTPHVFGAATGGYGDNLLRAPDGGDVRRDFYGRGEAGARADVQVYEHLISAEYRASGWLYSKETDLDSLEQAASGRLDLTFPKFEVHGEGGWNRSFYSDLILIRGIVRQDSESGTGYIRAKLGDLSLSAGGGFQRIDFRTGGLNAFDHDAILASAQVGYAFHERVQVSLGYNYEKVIFDSSSQQDYQVHGFRVGLSGPFSPKLSFSLNAGGDFQIVEPAPNPRAKTREYEGLASECAVAWHPWDTVSVTVAYRRDLRWSPDAEFQVNDYVLLSASQTFFDGKVESKATAAYERVTPSRGENVDRFFPSVRLTWRIIGNWLATFVEYTYDQTWSKDRNFRYEANRVELTLAAAF
jgi:hypothetical protein